MSSHSSSESIDTSMTSDSSSDSTHRSLSSESSSVTSKIQYPVNRKSLILQFAATFRNDTDTIQVPSFYHEQWAPQYPAFVRFRYDGTIYQIRLRQHHQKVTPDLWKTAPLLNRVYLDT
ncbi:uncharacterized protein LOC114387580 [Glycine soja]|uniref:uncharacterized protein LOC114387580 n=1 Tax=Glycine soja TaxID=3848 RepID=UPI00103EB843|nr:uncharacterized protein LOC114387580 [Glycine soja]XP_028203583.1 uncharacterized protein LOC114387580 [Glycine soja]